LQQHFSTNKKYWWQLFVEKVEEAFQKQYYRSKIKSRTVKAAALNGYEDCPNFVTVLVYDTKPMHFFSMSCETIEWITKEQKVFAASAGIYEKLLFWKGDTPMCQTN
jgi:hypothetical protein